VVDVGGALDALGTLDAVIRAGDFVALLTVKLLVEAWPGLEGASFEHLGAPLHAK
jgi:hypothetical protein